METTYGQCESHCKHPVYAKKEYVVLEGTTSVQAGENIESFTIYTFDGGEDFMVISAMAKETPTEDLGLVTTCADYQTGFNINDFNIPAVSLKKETLSSGVEITNVVLWLPQQVSATTYEYRILLQDVTDCRTLKLN